MRRNRRQHGGAADGTERACAANGKWSRLGMMTDKEMIEDMLDMQVKLDEVLLKVRGFTYRDLLRQRAYDRAILDELGELNHELKGDWCWWKKSQKPVDRQRVLEEFVDVLHFCLSQTLAEIACAQHPAFHWEILMHIFEKHLSGNELDILDWQECCQHVLVKAFYLMNWLEFTLAEVYEAYKKKNAVNRQRIEEGY